MTSEEGQAFADRMGTLFVGELRPSLSHPMAADIPLQSALPRQTSTLQTPSRSSSDA